MWGERNCLRFETPAGGIEQPSPRLTDKIVRRSTARQPLRTPTRYRSLYMAIGVVCSENRLASQLLQIKSWRSVSITLINSISAPVALSTVAVARFQCRRHVTWHTFMSSRHQISGPIIQPGILKLEYRFMFWHLCCYIWTRWIWCKRWLPTNTKQWTFRHQTVAVGMLCKIDNCLQLMFTG